MIGEWVQSTTYLIMLKVGHCFSYNFLSLVLVELSPYLTLLNPQVWQMGENIYNDEDVAVTNTELEAGA